MTININEFEFNCLENGKAPNWKDYDDVEVSAVVEKNGSCEAIDSDDPRTPSFFTVYGRHKDGRALALHDCDTMAEAAHLGRYVMQAIIDTAIRLTKTAKTPDGFYCLFNDFTCAAACVERLDWITGYHWRALRWPGTPHEDQLKEFV